MRDSENPYFVRDLAQLLGEKISRLEKEKVLWSNWRQVRCRRFQLEPVIGNGGSAADAQHIAAELVGRFKLERVGLPAMTLTTNTSILTALANDYGYDSVFSRQLEVLASERDVLIAITTGGTSPNILKSVETAHSKGATVIGLTGAKGSRLKDIADLTIAVPSDNTARIQEAHITVGHTICYVVEKWLFHEQSGICR